MSGQDIFKGILSGLATLSPGGMDVLKQRTSERNRTAELLKERLFQQAQQQAQFAHQSSENALNRTSQQDLEQSRLAAENARQQKSEDFARDQNLFGLQVQGLIRPTQNAPTVGGITPNMDEILGNPVVHNSTGQGFVVKTPEERAQAEADMQNHLLGIKANTVFNTMKHLGFTDEDAHGAVASDLFKYQLNPKSLDQLEAEVFAKRAKDPTVKPAQLLKDLMTFQQKKARAGLSPATEAHLNAETANLQETLRDKHVREAAQNRVNTAWANTHQAFKGKLDAPGFDDDVIRQLKAAHDGNPEHLDSRTNDDAFVQGVATLRAMRSKAPSVGKPDIVQEMLQRQQQNQQTQTPAQTQNQY